MAALINEHTQYVDSAGKPLVNGKLYVGTQGADPVLNPITIYSDRALTSALANPQTLDANGRTTNKIWVPAAYSVQVNDSLGVQKFQDLDAGEPSGINVTGLINELGTNTYTAGGSPTITAYADQAIFSLTVPNTNTGDVTLNIDGLGAKAVYRNIDQQINPGQWVQNQIVMVQYNSTTGVFNWLNENQKVQYIGQGADIAAAATVNLANATGNSLDITGHAGPIASFGTVPEGTTFNLVFPGSAPVTITSSSVASPSNILCAAVHGLTTGDEVIISGHSGSVPDINGRHTVTVVDTTNFTIPVNVTTGGTGGTSTGVPKITYNATSMILPGEQDIEVKPGDSAYLLSLGSGNWKCLFYQPRDGAIVRIATQAEAEGWVENSRTMTPLRFAQAWAKGQPWVFTASGTWVFQPGMSKLLVLAIAAGGAGAGTPTSNWGTGGGGGGAAIMGIVTVTGDQAVTIGAGGVAGTGNGPAGGDTTFGSLVTAKGGSGGTSATSGAGGNGGARTGNSLTGTILLNQSGVKGESGSDAAYGGAGGASGWNPVDASGIAVGASLVGNYGAQRKTASNSTGNASPVVGGGGSGVNKVSGGALNGGDGADGLLIVWPIQG